MNLYLIEADTEGYDVYSGAVVVADSIVMAQRTHPNGSYTWDDRRHAWLSAIHDPDEEIFPDDTWAPPSAVKVTYLGKPEIPEPRVVLASFHAG